jgi:predicted AAA+ superfamily ATPase
MRARTIASAPLFANEGTTSAAEGRPIDAIPATVDDAPLCLLSPPPLPFRHRTSEEIRPVSEVSPADLAAVTAELRRIADLLARAVPPPPKPTDFSAAEAFVWLAREGRAAPVVRVNRVEMSLLKGIDRVRDQLLGNTERFARGLPANNALLWGARGMGKSSLVKAVHAAVNRTLAAEGRPPLRLVEIHREDIESLPALLGLVARASQRFLVFCDDLSFDAGDTSYKSLKAVLEGGIEGRPANVLFYATSNRRHLLPRDMIDNERSTAINPNEGTEEKVSLSDRFGLWLGFHKCDQEEYLAMVRGYVAHFGLDVAEPTLVAESLEWATTRGSRSGRTAWQYVQDLAGRSGRRLEEDG